MAIDLIAEKATMQRLERYLSELLCDHLELLQFERIGGGWSR